MTDIGQDAFSETSWYDNQPDGLVYVGKVAYAYKGDMPSGTRIRIQAETKGIAGGAFSGRDNLVVVTIPNSVVSIGNSAFSSCSRLTSINIPANVTYIGPYAFSYCSLLSSIAIPNGVKTIYNYTFSNCTSLATVIIGKGVESYYYDAFYNCVSLTDVYCYREAVAGSYNTSFSGKTDVSNATLHVPAGSVEAYRAASTWGMFGEIVAIASDEMSGSSMR